MDLLILIITVDLSLSLILLSQKTEKEQDCKLISPCDEKEKRLLFMKWILCLFGVFQLLRTY